MKINCEHCGKEFDKKISEYNRRKHHYCSVHCAQDYQRNLATLGRDDRNTCDFCGNVIDRPNSQITNSRKLRSKHIFCNKECKGKFYQLPRVSHKCLTCSKDFDIPESLQRNMDQRGQIRKYCSIECVPKKQPSGRKRGNSNNRSWGFRTRYRNPASKIIVDLFNKQSGRCAITNVLMTKERGSPYTFSVDRIDSSLGYIDGNMQLVCVAANFMKNKFTMDEIRAFVDDIRKQI